MTNIIFKPENIEGFDGFHWDKADVGAWWGPLNDWNVSHRDFIDSLPNRRTVIQAGGNLGLYPTLLSSRFEHVITFEPDPDNFEILHKNIEHHKLANVIAINSALGEANRETAMVKGPADNVGMHRIDDAGPTKVPMLALDSIFDEFKDHIDLIWLDIELYEFPALKGAMKTIDQFKPVVMVENANNGIAWLLAEHGYRETRVSKMDTIFEFKG